MNRQFLVARRYFDLVCLTTISLLICIVAEPITYIAQSKVVCVLQGFEAFYQYFFCGMIAAAIYFAVKSIGGFRWSDMTFWRQWPYPPVWYFALIGSASYILIVHHWPVSLQHRTLNPSIRDIAAVTIGIAVPAIYNAICDWLYRQNVADDDNLKTSTLWESAELPIQFPERDEFEYTSTATRVAALSLDRLRSIALIGRPGSGKSSVINLIEHVLSKPEEFHLDPILARKIIFSRATLWGQTVGSAASHVLNVVVRELSRIVDTTTLTELPRQYKSALSKVTPAWGGAITDFLSADHVAEEVLVRLDDVLGCTSKRLVIFIEDVDRGPDAILVEIEALLDRLKVLKNVAFIFAYGKAGGPPEALTRVAEHIEIIPDLSKSFVMNSVRACRDQCYLLANTMSDLDTLSEEERRQRLPLFNKYYEIADIVGGDVLLPFEAICLLLTNPRTLKLTLRTYRRVWQSLHGETDVDDLLALTVLRCAAPEAFNFIINNLGKLRARHNSRAPVQGEDKDKTDRLNSNWRSCVADVDWDRLAAWVLIEFLFPKEHEQVIQGVAIQSPTDYFLRATRETLGADEIRDQEILHSLESWKRNKNEGRVRGHSLPEATLQLKGIAEKLEQFASEFDGGQVRTLAEDLFSEILKHMVPPSKDLAEPGYRGFHELLDIAKMKRSKEHTTWVIEQIRRCAPIDMYLASYIAFEWSSDVDGHIDPRRSDPQIRDAFLGAMKDAFQDKPIELESALKIGNGHTLSRVLFWLTSREQGRSGYGPESWEWLGTTLEKGLNQGLSNVCAQVLVMLAPGRDFLERAPDMKLMNQTRFVFDEPLGKRLFGQGLRSILQKLIGDIPVTHLGGDEKADIADRQKALSSWLAENSGEAAKEE